MPLNSKLSSLLDVLKIPPESDAFMLKRAYKSYIVKIKDEECLKYINNLYYNSFKSLQTQNSLKIWDCKRRQFISFKDLPFFPKGMIFSKTYDDSVLLAGLQFLGCRWDLSNISYVKKKSDLYLSAIEKGFFIERRYYIPEHVCKSISNITLFVFLLFCKSNQVFIELITKKYFTKEFNINLVQIFADSSGKFKWLNKQKTLKLKSENIYLNYAN
jgi:hypothetical protein